MQLYNYISLALVVICTVGAIGCSESHSPPSSPLPSQHDYAADEVVTLNGHVISSVTIPPFIQHPLFVRESSSELLTSSSNLTIEQDRLILATTPTDQEGDNGARDVQVISVLAREQQNGVYLGDTYIRLYNANDQVQKYSYGSWLIYEQLERSHPERWICITRRKQWGDLIVIVQSSSISKSDVIEILNRIEYENKSEFLDPQTPQR